MPAARKLPCPKCGYDLRGQPQSTLIKCPECGGEFSIDAILNRVRRRSLVIAGLIGLSPGSTFVFGFVADHFRGGVPSTWWDMARGLAIGVSVCCGPFTIIIIASYLASAFTKRSGRSTFLPTIGIAFALLVANVIIGAAIGFAAMVLGWINVPG